MSINRAIADILEGHVEEEDTVLPMGELDQFCLELSCSINVLAEKLGVSTFVTYLGREDGKALFKIAFSRLSDFKELGSIAISADRPMDMSRKIEKILNGISLEGVYKYD